MKNLGFQVVILVIVFATAALVVASLSYPHVMDISQDSSSSEGPARLVSVQVDRPRVRSLSPREGVYVYETAPRKIPFEGIYYERWVYNLAEEDGSKWLVTGTNYAYLIKHNRTMEFIPVIYRYTIDASGLAINENYTVGDNTTVVGWELPPVTNYCIQIPVAPTWFIYLTPGERITINVVVTYLRPGGGVKVNEEIGFPPRGQELVDERFAVGDEIIPCYSPSGKCFEVRSELSKRFLEDGRLTYQRTNRYHILIDAVYGIVILLEEYVGEDVVMRVSLVSWK